MSNATKKRNLENYEFSPAARACIRRLKKRYGTKKNAIETAVFSLEQTTKATK